MQPFHLSSTQRCLWCLGPLTLAQGDSLVDPEVRYWVETGINCPQDSTVIQTEAEEGRAWARRAKGKVSYHEHPVMSNALVRRQTGAGPGPWIQDPDDLR